MGPLGRKVVTPNPPLSALGAAQGGLRGHNFSTQWSHCFGFGPSRSSFLVLRRSKGWGSQLFDQWNQWMRSFGFGPSRSSILVLRRSKGWGSQLFDQWNQWTRSFGFGPSRSLSQGSLSKFSLFSFKYSKP